MLTYRRKTQLFEYPIFNSESISKYISWDNIAARICRTLEYLFRDNSLYNVPNTKSFTPEEMVALCNLPLYDTTDNILVTMDIDDINNGLVVSDILSKKVYDYLILREIKIKDRYKISSPGYRIFTNIDSSDRYIISIIRDERSPENEDDLIRLFGELSELVLQRELQLLGVPISYNPPDYRVYTDSESTYHATGFIVMNDYPSIRDILFEFQYLTVLISGIETGYSECNQKIIPNDKICIYFGIDYKDKNSWCLTLDELKEFLTIDFTDKQSDIKYAINKIHKIYLETNNEE